MELESEAMDALPLEAWLAVAEGTAPMPQPFQRFIAAWELMLRGTETKTPERLLTLP